MTALDWNDALAAKHLPLTNLVESIIGDDHSTLGLEQKIQHAQESQQTE